MTDEQQKQDQQFFCSLVQQSMTECTVEMDYSTRQREEHQMPMRRGRKDSSHSLHTRPCSSVTHSPTQAFNEETLTDYLLSLLGAVLGTWIQR